MMMDTYEAGRSTTSSSSDALHREAVDSCTLSFQGYFSISALFEAINDHAVRFAGVPVDLQRLSGLLDATDGFRLFPPALVSPHLADLCAGELDDLLVSRNSHRLFTRLYCAGDEDLAAEMFAANVSSVAELRIARAGAAVRCPPPIVTGPPRGSWSPSERGADFGGASDDHSGSTPSPDSPARAALPRGAPVLRSAFGDHPAAFPEAMRTLRILLLGPAA